jgi:hypothetical protein
VASILVYQLCFIIKGIVAPSGAMATLNINLISGSKAPMVMEPQKMVEVLGVVL